MTDESPLNTTDGFTVSVYFPPGSDPEWVSGFLDRVATDAHGMPSETLDAFVVGHARDVLGIDSDTELTRGEALQRDLGEAARFAFDAMKPAAEPVFCHHPDARRTVHETMQAGWGRCSVVRLECPTCHEWAEQLNDEPVLAPKLLNAGRCTEACTEQHTARPGCLLAPDWGRKP